MEICLPGTGGELLEPTAVDLSPKVSADTTEAPIITTSSTAPPMNSGTRDRGRLAGTLTTGNCACRGSPGAGVAGNASRYASSAPIRRVILRVLLSGAPGFGTW